MGGTTTTTTTLQCTIPSYTSMEYLLVQSAALLCDCSVEYKVLVGAPIRLEATSTSKFTETSSTAVALGWTGVVRLLASFTPLLQLSPIQESWLEAVDLTLMPILTQAKKEPVFEGAVLEFVQRIAKTLAKNKKKPENKEGENTATYLEGTTISLADACTAQVLLSTLQLLNKPTVPSAVHAWATTSLAKLGMCLPYASIPGWRNFGLQRSDVWSEWTAFLQKGGSINISSSTAAKKEATPSPAPAAADAKPSASASSSSSSSFDDPDNAVLNKLKELGIAFEAYAHPLCMTAEELVQNVPLAGAPDQESHTKNLFMRDKKHGHFLVTLHPDSACNPKELGKLLNLQGKTNLRLADPKILDEKLHVKPGCVGPLGMCMADLTLDDKERVTLVLDAALLKLKTIHSHPLRNDASVKTTPTELQSYLQKLGVTPTVLEFSKEDKNKAAGAAAAAPAQKPPAKKESNGAPKQSQKQAVAAKKGETLLALQWKKKDNFPNWYSDVIVLSEMISYYDISGCYILRPWAYKQWELIQEWFNDKIRDLGVENAYFPMFVSKARLNKEKDHVEGFAPEVAWVTKSGDGELAEPIAVRPTSETIMYPAYSDWIKSHRDLPLKLNQWSNVVRWEFKYPTPFLRTREFLWQEGHTAHATFEDADDMVMKALDLYRRVYEELLAVPVVPGFKTEKEKFAGGFRTTTVEAYIAGSGRAIQGATSHNLGQNFGKMFDITFQNEKGKSETAWQTSWGLTTRTIGVMIMVHGDDTGLVLPPRVAPLQVVVVPIFNKKFSAEEAAPHCEAIVNDLKAAGIRVKYDDRTTYNPGWKYAHWEQKGVPLRVEVGPRDVEKKSVTVVTRHNGTKEELPMADLGKTLSTKLDEIQTAMFEKAKVARDGHIVQITEWKDLVPNLEKNNLVLTPWIGGEHQDWEEKVKELSREESLKARGEEVEDEKTATSVAAKSLCIPFKQPDLPKGTKCIISGEEATCWILWGRSY